MRCDPWGRGIGDVTMAVIIVVEWVPNISYVESGRRTIFS